jgi:hypothetical protein
MYSCGRVKNDDITESLHSSLYKQNKFTQTVYVDTILIFNYSLQE